MTAAMCAPSRSWLITLRKGGPLARRFRGADSALGLLPGPVVVAEQGLHGCRAGVADCLNGRMTPAQEQPGVVSASREIAAGPGRIFELIADPAQQPRWDGNDNLAEAPPGSGCAGRVRCSR